MSHGITQEQYDALLAENLMLKNQVATKGPGLSLKVTVPRKAGTNGEQDKGSDGGAVAVYGLGRFPVTLYAGQWEKLANFMPQVVKFIQANEQNLSRK